MDPILETRLALTRRHFFGRSAAGIGTAALACLLNEDVSAGGPGRAGGLPGLPHFPPKARRVIYLFQSGAPSRMDLFDYRPKLNDLRGSELPESIRRGQRLTGMTATQPSFPVAPSQRSGKVIRLNSRSSKILAMMCSLPQTPTVNFGVVNPCENFHEPSQSTLATQQTLTCMPTETIASKVMFSDSMVTEVGGNAGNAGSNVMVGGMGSTLTPRAAERVTDALTSPPSTSTQAVPVRMTINVTLGKLTSIWNAITAFGRGFE